MSNLFFSLNTLKPFKSNAYGSITRVTNSEVPGLVNVSFASFKLNKQCAVDPIWHVNAHKIGYCEQGKALISLRSPSAVDNFTVEAGDVFFIPQGYVHYIANVSNEELMINFAFNHTSPHTMFLSKSFFSLSDSVFTATFNTPASFYEGLKKNQKEDLFKQLPDTRNLPSVNSKRYKVNISSSKKTVQTKGGYLQLAIKQNLPSLEGLGILGFGLNPKGVVEPHWHTNAGELVYIVKGKTKITVLAPDGNLEVLEVNAGQGAFAAASHFHNIENVGDEDVEVIAYFTDAEPDYIGLGEVMGSYTNEVLASIFNVNPGYFDSVKEPTEPLVIVPV